jgi:hypothetical protein
MQLLHPNCNSSLLLRFREIGHSILLLLRIGCCCAGLSSNESGLDGLFDSIHTATFLCCDDEN